jgi:NADH-quinone oxidoreductase subunit H
MFIRSVVMATLYFGGYDIPFLNESLLSPNVAAIVGIIALFIKVVIFIFFFMWVHWTIPRFRYDQLMNLGWKSLVPLALFNMIITGLFILWFGK